MMDPEAVAKAIYPAIASARDFHGHGALSWEDASREDEWAIDEAFHAADRVLALLAGMRKGEVL